MSQTLERIMSMDVAAGFEGRFARGAGNANVGINVVSVSSPAPPANRYGENCLRFSPGKGTETFLDGLGSFTLTNATNYNVETFWLRFNNIENLDTHVTTEIFFFEFIDSGGGCIKVSIKATGGFPKNFQILTYDKNDTSSEVSSAETSPFTDDIWHFISIAWIHKNTGTLAFIRIDGNQEGSGTGIFANNTSTNGRPRWQGQVDTSEFPFGTNMCLWGYNHIYNSTTDRHDNEENYGIKVFRPGGKSGRVPQYGIGTPPGLGDDAILGDANQIANNGSGFVRFAELKAGAWATDKWRGVRGPKTFFNPGVVAIGAEWTLWATSGTSFGLLSNIIYGSDDSTATRANLGTGANHKGVASQMAGGPQFPVIDQDYCVIGGEGSLFANTISISELWVDYEVEADGSDVDRDITVKLLGDIVFNGNTVIR